MFKAADLEKENSVKSKVLKKDLAANKAVKCDLEFSDIFNSVINKFS